MASNLRDRAAALPKMPEDAKRINGVYHYGGREYAVYDDGNSVAADFHRDEAEALRAQRDLLVEALDGVIRIADRRTDEFDGARAVLDAVRGKR